MKFGMAEEANLAVRHFGSINLVFDLVIDVFVGNKYENFGFLDICIAIFLVILCLLWISVDIFSFSNFSKYVICVNGKIILTAIFCIFSNIFDEDMVIELFHRGAANSRIDLRNKK